MSPYFLLTLQYICPKNLWILDKGEPQNAAIHPTGLSNLTACRAHFGRSSEFGFEKLLQIFNLLAPGRYQRKGKLGIGSVSVTLPHSHKKTPYLSSAY